MRLQCCRGFYESRGACVRESRGATPLPSASPALSVSKDKAATSNLCL